MGAFNHAHRVNPNHVAGFYKQRPNGSQWGTVPPSPSSWAVLGWEEVDYDAMPPGTALAGCRYFRSTHPILIDGSVEHVGLSSELDRERVFLVTGGPHGPYLATTQELPQKPATEAWLILGPAGGGDMNYVPWTAFPGRMAAAIPPTTEKIEELDLTRPYAVKYISKETAELCA